MGVQRRGVLVALVDVATTGVGLPDLDELVPDRAAVAVDHPPGHLHPLADRLAVVLHGQVGLAGADVALAEDGRPELHALGIGLVRALGGVPQQARAVRRVVEAGPGLLAGRTRRRPASIAAISSLTSRWEARAASEDEIEVTSRTLRRRTGRDVTAGFR